MTSEKKNQHYIPKFYLRNFSFCDNKKQIGLYNTRTEFYIPTATLKSQGSKNFFYGQDGAVEDRLSKIEGRLAQIIRTIINEQALPKKQTEEHFDLLTFVALTDIRNPISIDSTKAQFTAIQNRVLELAPDSNLDEVFPSISHDELIRLSFSNLPVLTACIVDLDFKLIKNKSNIPFISSDNPVVRYNQYLQWRKWPQARTGYGQTGLQIIVPINDELALLFFDSGIYKVGNKRDKIVSIQKPDDIDSINTLQIVNSFENLYFNEKVTEWYIRSLHQKSQKYKKANSLRVQREYLFKNDDQKKELLEREHRNLLILNSTDPETNFSIEAMRIHSVGREHKLHPSMSQMRPAAERMKAFLDRSFPA